MIRKLLRAALVLLTAATSLSGSNGHNARIVATSSQGAVAAPSTPVAGYAAWYDAGTGVYSDGACSVPQTSDGGGVACWAVRDGSYGALNLTVPGGYGTPTLQQNEVNALPVVRSLASNFDLYVNTSSSTIFEGGLLNVGSGTVFSVVRSATIDGTNRGIWGDSGGYIFSLLVDGGGVAGHHAIVYEGAYKTARKAATAASPHILTWHHSGGVIYSGVDDTQDVSLASASAGDMDATAGYLVALGASGPGAYCDCDLAELIFYPTALSEADRKLVERYLAAKYAIAIGY